MKYALVLLVLLVAIAPAYAVSDNWVTNGDFENGLTGWTAGTFGVQATIAPTAFGGGTTLNKHDWSGADLGATAVSAYSGKSAGWARIGSSSYDGKSWNYIAQTVTVKAGTYTVNSATWKAYASTTNQCAAAMFLMRVDGQIGQAYVDDNGAKTFRSTRWDYAGTGWMDKSVAAGSSFTTAGQVQFILAFQDNDSRTTNEARSAGFDNFVFKTNEAQVVPEPGSIVTLLSGAVGLAGFAIRRRK